MDARLGAAGLHPKKKEKEKSLKGRPGHGVVRDAEERPGRVWKNPFVDLMYEWGTPDQEVVDVTNKTKLSG